MTQQPPDVPAPPPRPGRPTFVFQGAGPPGPQEIYQGFRAQRRVLADQLDELEDTRESITSELMSLPVSSSHRTALENRLAEVDKGIASVDGMLAANAAQLAQAAAVPGAVVQPPREIRQGPPEEVLIVGTIFMAIVLLPLSIALARRIWKRSVNTVTAFPRELADRFSRMENAIEATSLEVERIGEGQRFLTRLLSERESPKVIGSGAAERAGGTQLLERKQGAP